MKLTIHDQKLLSNCCEELIKYTKEKESTFVSFLKTMDQRALSSDEAMEALQAALRIEQIYFRIIHILNYIDKHPDEFTGAKSSWVKEAHRISAIYASVENKYFKKLVKHSINILEAYNVSHEPPKSYAAEARMEKGSSPLLIGNKKASIVSDDAERDHIQFKIDTSTDVLREIVKNRDYPLVESPASNGSAKPSKQSIAVAQLHAAQLQVESFILEGRDIDRTMVNDLDVYAQQQYRILVNQHEPINIWLDILTSATTTAQNSMRKVFHEVKVRQEQIDRAERAAVKIVVGVFCGPAGGFVDPVFNVFKALSDSVLSGNRMTSAINHGVQGSDNASTSEQLGSFVQWVMKSEVKADPITTIIKTLESNPPNTTLEWMKKYMDYKISGPKAFAEMFQRDTELWSFDNPTHEDDINIDPIYVIKAKRRELMEKYKLNTQDAPWIKHFSSQEYKKLFTKIKNDLWEHFTGSVDSIFNAYSAQYIPAQGLRDIVGYIKQKTFDDNKAGLASFDRANYEEIINTIANELKLAGLLRYAMTYDPYWGGSANPTVEHLKAINDGTFRPEMNGRIGIERNWKTDLLNKAIYDCYIKTQPGPAHELHNPFIDFDRIDDFRCTRFKARYTPQQVARFDKIEGIMHEYFSTPIDTRLLNSIEKKLNKQGANVPNSSFKGGPIQGLITGASIRNILPMGKTQDNASLNPSSQAIDRMHEWKSAKSLYTEAKEILKPYIMKLKTDREAVREERSYAKTWLFSKINLLRTTKLNKHIEAVKAKAAASPPATIKPVLGNNSI